MAKQQDPAVSLAVDPDGSVKPHSDLPPAVDISAEIKPGPPPLPFGVYIGVPAAPPAVL